MTELIANMIARLERIHELHSGDRGVRLLLDCALERIDAALTISQWAERSPRRAPVFIRPAEEP